MWSIRLKMFVNKHTSLIFWPKVCKKRFCPVLTWDSAAILQSFFQPQKLTGLQHSCPTSEWCQALISHSSKKHSSWQKCWLVSSWIILKFPFWAICKKKTLIFGDSTVLFSAKNDVDLRSYAIRERNELSTGYFMTEFVSKNLIRNLFSHICMT